MNRNIRINVAATDIATGSKLIFGPASCAFIEVASSEAAVDPPDGASAWKRPHDPALAKKEAGSGSMTSDEIWSNMAQSFCSHVG